MIMTNNKFLIRLLPILALSFFIVSCGGNADTAGDEAATDQTEHTHDDGHMHEGDHMEAGADKQGPEYTSAYICPMHCEGSGSDEPGECPVCGMDYVKNENMPADGHMHEEGHDHEGHNH